MLLDFVVGGFWLDHNSPRIDTFVMNCRLHQNVFRPGFTSQSDLQQFLNLISKIFHLERKFVKIILCSHRPRILLPFQTLMIANGLGNSLKDMQSCIYREIAFISKLYELVLLGQEFKVFHNLTLFKVFNFRVQNNEG